MCTFVCHLKHNRSVKSKTMKVLKKLIEYQIKEFKKTYVTQPNWEKSQSRVCIPFPTVRRNQTGYIKSNQILPVAFEDVRAFGNRLGKTAAFLHQRFLRQFTWQNIVGNKPDENEFSGCLAITSSMSWGGCLIIPDLDFLISNICIVLKIKFICKEFHEDLWVQMGAANGVRFTFLIWIFAKNGPAEWRVS